MLLKNKSKMVSIQFGVPYFEVFDYHLTEFSVPIAVRGEISFFVKNYKKFLKKNGFNGMPWDEFQSLVRSNAIRHVKDFIANAPSKYQLPVVHLEKKIEKLSTILQAEISTRLKKEFKIQIFSVDITAIEIDATSENYRYLQTVTKNVTGDKILAQAKIELENMQNKAQADRENYREELQIKRNRKRNFQKWIALSVMLLGVVSFAVIIIFLL